MVNLIKDRMPLGQGSEQERTASFQCARPNRNGGGAAAHGSQKFDERSNEKEAATQDNNPRDHTQEEPKLKVFGPPFIAVCL